MNKFPGFPKEPEMVMPNGTVIKEEPVKVIWKLMQEIKKLKEKGQSYYCVIPWKLLTDKKISPNAKLLYGEISALANREGYCWASNKHFGETLGLKGNTTISKLINDLKKANYIYVEIDKSKGNKRKIWLYPPILKNHDRYLKKSREGILKNHDKDNNILDNNKENIYIKPKKFSSIKDVTEEVLVEISKKYKVSLGFVKFQWEKLQNWCEAKGKRYKNYKKALMNWVLMDMQRQIERRQQNGSKQGIDARRVE